MRYFKYIAIPTTVVCMALAFQNCGKAGKSFSGSNSANSEDSIIEHQDDDGLIEIIPGADSGSFDSGSDSSGSGGSQDSSSSSGGNDNSGSSSGGGSTSSTSGGSTNTDSTSGSNGGGTNSGTSTGGTVSGGSASSGSTTGSTSVSYINFVGGTQAGCDALVTNKYNVCYVCKVGGGCGNSCGKPGGSCVSANPSLPGACFTTTEKPVSNCPATKICKVVFSSGATASSQQATQALCQNYYQQLKTNNPNQTFSAVYYDGALIMNFTKVCKVTFYSGATSATSVTSQTECRNYYNTLVKNNPNSNFSYVHFDGSLIIDNTKVCKVTFKSGASAATSVITKAQCQSYYSEIKKNNPNSPISKVTFDGTNIL